MASVFGQAFLTIDGELLAENTSYQTSLERANVADVHSVTGNFEGTDIGPVVRVVTADNVVAENNAWSRLEGYYLEGRKVTLGVEDTSGHRFLSMGRFVSMQRTGGVGQTMTVSFAFRGAPTAML